MVRLPSDGVIRNMKKEDIAVLCYRHGLTYTNCVARNRKTLLEHRALCICNKETPSTTGNRTVHFLRSNTMDSDLLRLTKLLDIDANLTMFLEKWGVNSVSSLQYLNEKDKEFTSLPMVDRGKLQKLKIMGAQLLTELSSPVEAPYLFPKGHEQDGIKNGTCDITDNKIEDSVKWVSLLDMDKPLRKRENSQGSFDSEEEAYVSTATVTDSPSHAITSGTPPQGLSVGNLEQGATMKKLEGWIWSLECDWEKGPIDCDWEKESTTSSFTSKGKVIPKRNGRHSKKKAIRDQKKDVSKRLQKRRSGARESCELDGSYWKLSTNRPTKNVKNTTERQKRQVLDSKNTSVDSNLKRQKLEKRISRDDYVKTPEFPGRILHFRKKWLSDSDLPALTGPSDALSATTAPDPDQHYVKNSQSSQPGVAPPVEEPILSQPFSEFISTTSAVTSLFQSSKLVLPIESPSVLFSPAPSKLSISKSEPAHEPSPDSSMILHVTAPLVAQQSTPECFSAESLTGVSPAPASESKAENTSLLRSSELIALVESPATIFAPEASALPTNLHVKLSAALLPTPHIPVEFDSAAGVRSPLFASPSHAVSPERSSAPKSRLSYFGTTIRYPEVPVGRPHLHFAIQSAQQRQPFSGSNGWHPPGFTNTHPYAPQWRSDSYSAGRSSDRPFLLPSPQGLLPKPTEFEQDVWLPSHPHISSFRHPVRSPYTQYSQPTMQNAIAQRPRMPKLEFQFLYPASGPQVRQQNFRCRYTPASLLPIQNHGPSQWTPTLIPGYSGNELFREETAPPSLQRPPQPASNSYDPYPFSEPGKFE